jgi:hypothetical protein
MSQFSVKCHIMNKSREWPLAPRFLHLGNRSAVSFAPLNISRPKNQRTVCTGQIGVWAPEPAWESEKSLAIPGLEPHNLSVQAVAYSQCILNYSGSNFNVSSYLWKIRDSSVSTVTRLRARESGLRILE